MSERKRRRGRPRGVPSLSYGTEFKLRNNSPRIIKKPKYLSDPDEDTSVEYMSDIYGGKTPQNGSKAKNSRGYNPEIVDKLKDSEYHYGSDFENELSDNGNISNVSSSTSDTSSSSDDMSDMDEGALSDTVDTTTSEGIPNMWWKLGPAGSLGMRPHTPTPVWLQDRSYPKLVLPKSSDDLLIPMPLLMKAISIYEVLRHFHSLVRLSPFHFEEFCVILMSEEQSGLLAEIHISLLKALIREEDSQQTHFGPLDQKDSANITLYCIDYLTWPETLRLYLQSDPEYKSYLKILEDSNYPFTSVKERLEILQFLCDQFLQTTVVREDLISEGKIRYDDICRSCHKTGDLLCCDSCPAVYHLECINPPLSDTPAALDDWTCVVCKAQEFEGITDCMSPLETSGILCRQEPLGFDRHGRKYWFLIRRIFVESEDGDLYYYSTVGHFDLLLSLFDSSDLEEGLMIALKDFGEDIRRQMKITEKLTDKARGNKPSWLSKEKEELEKERLILMEPNIKNEEAKHLDSMIEEVKDEIKEEDSSFDKMSSSSVDTTKVKSEDVKPDIKEEKIDLTPLIKEKTRQISSLCPTFRFGCDYMQRSYTNIYSTNPLALNKQQHNEERDKKRHLSHKFSLSANTEFKWNGPTTGSNDILMTTIKQTLVALEQNTSSHFFHPIWQNIRRGWTQFLVPKSDTIAFVRGLRLLVACLKPAIFNNVWHDSLGHSRLKRITATEREEKKKQEKKDKKEADEESKYFCFVKYTKGVKHQLWKVKGEEYRIHGLWGWLWHSSLRRCHHLPMSTRGLRSGPDKIMIPIKSTIPIKAQGASFVRGLPISPSLYKQLAVKSKYLQVSILSPNQRRMEEQNDSAEEEKKNEIIIANADVQQKVEIVAINLEDYFEDGLVNVSKSLNARSRFVYPKVAKLSTLDALLTRRLALKIQEEKEIATKKIEGKNDDEQSKESENGDSDETLSEISEVDNVEELPDSHRSSINKLKPAGNLLKELKIHKQKYETLDKLDDGLPCYSSSCREKGRSKCYSPSCILKERTKQKLINTVNHYKIVTNKPSPYDQVGMFSPVKFADKESLNLKSANEETDSSVDKAKLDESSNASQDSEDKMHTKFERIYSTESPSGKIYLKRYNAEIKRKKITNKIPPLSRFKVCGKVDRYSLLILPQWELKILARRCGKYNPLIFNANAKSNQSVWPYPCSRPYFKTTWLFRTSTLFSINAAALQLRILWSCLRWDDMQEKCPPDGRKQVTTDMEIIQTEILKRKYSGRFMEHTQYLQRKVIIPYDVHKPVREFTPSQRSGLRKRRRAQSPVSKEPQSIEEWIDEEKVQLWEIKSFGERLEKAALVNKKAINNEKNGDSNNFQSINLSSSPAEFKAKIEEQLKIQRATFNQQKKAMEGQSIGTRGIVKVGVGNALSNSSSKVSITGSPLAIKTSTTAATNQLPSVLAGRKIVTTKGGKIITVQATAPSLNQNEPTKLTLGGGGSVFPLTSLPKVQVTSSGNKVIQIQTVSSGQQRPILPRSMNPTSIVSNATSATSPALSNTGMPTAVKMPSGQQIQIVRLPDGNIQVRGLQEGQQVVQRPDGKLQLLNTKSPVSAVTPAPSPIMQSNQIKLPQKDTTVRGVTPLSSGQIVKINGQQVLLRSPVSNSKQITPTGNISGIKPTIVTNTTTQNTIPIKAFKTQEGIMIKSPLSVSNNQAPTTIKPQTADAVAPLKQTAVNPAPNTTSPTTSILTLRVQVRMTEQGPKTIIQGLEPGVGLTKDHIMAIQQQVRTMLAEYNLQVNQLSPLMTLTLQITNKNQNQPTVTPKPAQPILPIPNTQIAAMPKPEIDKAPETVAGDGIKKFKFTDNKSIIKSPEGGSESPKKFVLTNEYIQQTVKSALNRPDLSPDVEEKLVQLHKYTSDKGREGSLTPRDSPSLEDFSAFKGSKRTREQEEEEWDDTPKSRTKKTKAEKPLKIVKKEIVNNSNQAAKGISQDSKKRVFKLQKLEGLLSRHKDLLKKDILKKRALLEKELQLQIHKELALAKQHLQVTEKKRQVESPTKKKSGDVSPTFNESIVRPQKRSDTAELSPPGLQSPFKSNNKNNSKPKKTGKKSKKIVCICRTPFDDSKFYVGCDMCGNWFHGDCVGITEALSRTMTEYVCDDCANAKLNKELFCFCRQPYDEAQFYIFCEKCEGWYHGKCIGIMQQEAEDIDDYICPKCDPDTMWNYPCQKKFGTKDHAELKKVAKTLIQHKNSWPFLEPVDQSEVPDYYKVVKEPMDLKTIEHKVTHQKYSNLAEFCGDVMLVFDNCRAYNPPNSSFWSCANTLENFFCSKLKQLKLKVIQKS